jgi:type VI protein secretion system component VasK
MGVLLEEFSTIFYSVALMAGVTSVAFGAVMTRAVMFNNPLLDVALLFAFQQTLPRLIFIAILSYVGVFFAGLQRMVSGRL